MKWYDEFPQLFRRPIAEIGLAFLVREKLGNHVCMGREELQITLGENWFETVEGLRRSGVLKVEEAGKKFVLTIVAPGDKKRERCRLIGQRKRNCK